MKLTEGELSLLNRVKAEDTDLTLRIKRRTEILQTQVKPKMTVHDVDALLRRNGFFYSLNTVRKFLKQENIEYTYLKPKRKKGKSINIYPRELTR